LLYNQIFEKLKRFFCPMVSGFGLNDSGLSTLGGSNLSLKATYPLHDGSGDLVVAFLGGRERLNPVGG
jgi:hypothetical protein